MKKCYLVVNSFLRTPKFEEIYSLFKNSAERHGVILDIKTGEDLLSVLDEELKGNKPDFVVFYDKDVMLASRLEMEGIRCFNSSEAIRICDNKALTFLKLKGKGIPMPRTIIPPFTFANIGYTSFSFVDKAIKELPLPLVIKEVYGSFGSQVHKVNSKSEAIEVIKSLCGREFIFQEDIKEAEGVDIRINVVGDKVVSSIKRENEGSFTSNLTSGGTGSNYTPTKEEESLAIKCVEELGLDWAGVDILQSKRGPLLCEVNSNPHFKTSLDITGNDMSDEIFEYILKTYE